MKKQKKMYSRKEVLEHRIIITEAKMRLLKSKSNYSSTDLLKMDHYLKKIHDLKSEFKKMNPKRTAPQANRQNYAFKPQVDRATGDLIDTSTKPKTKRRITTTGASPIPPRS